MNTPDTEQYKCKSYYNDKQELCDCSCGKCGIGEIVESLLEELSYGGRKNLLDDTMGMDTAREILRTAITSRDTYWKERVRKEVEGMRKEHIPADNVWEGDEEQEVGEWKFVPKEDGMYCLNCKRFTPEEGCICGLISFETLDTLLDNLK